MLPGLLPLALWVIPHKDPWGLPLILSFLAIQVSVIVYAIARESDFARPGETLWHVSVMGYILPIVAMVFLLPGRSELALMTVGILAFGDGTAVLGGKLLRGPRLPWNRRKTWAGLCSFLIAGSIAASLYYWMEARPSVSLTMALAIAGPAALAGAITESLPIRSHDNFRVGVVAALTGLMMHVLLLGW
jgi:dolichol kinase